MQNQINIFYNANTIDFYITNLLQIISQIDIAGVGATKSTAQHYYRYLCKTFKAKRNFKLFYSKLAAGDFTTHQQIIDFITN